MVFLREVTRGVPHRSATKVKGAPRVTGTTESKYTVYKERHDCGRDVRIQARLSFGRRIGNGWILAYSRIGVGVGVADRSLLNGHTASALGSRFTGARSVHSLHIQAPKQTNEN